ncbi:MAG: glycosyltransferase family 2 protein [Thermoplasmata archaeon]
MPTDPDVAVVVGAFARTNYVARAVASVLAQTLPRDRFEVVVLTGFTDPALERSLAADGVTSVVDPEPRIGRWLLRAIRSTRAPLIAFLDDDDEFEPDRLERIVAFFREHPEVGFYRNRVRVIDTNGTSLPPERWRCHEVDAGFDRTGPLLIASEAKAGTLPLIAHDIFGSFNSSTMVVRRELFDGELGAAFEETQLPDIALLMMALLSPYSLFFDDARRTRFRWHGDNVTRRVDWLRHAAEAHASLAELAHRRGRDDFAGWLSGLSAHYDRVFHSATILDGIHRRAPRRRVATDFLDYLRFLGTHPAERRPISEVWPVELYALAYVCAPSWGRRVASAPAAVRGG